MTTKPNEKANGAQIVAAELFASLKTDWELNDNQIAVLLGKQADQEGRELVAEILDQKCTFQGEDIKERMRCLTGIRITLFAIFEDHPAGGKWLHANQGVLDHKSPMDLLLTGDMETMWEAHQFVEVGAGW